MKSQFSIVIVGAGITGLTLAALLAKGRHGDTLEITVIDAAKRPQFLPEEYDKGESKMSLFRLRKKNTDVVLVSNVEFGCDSRGTYSVPLVFSSTYLRRPDAPWVVPLKLLDPLSGFRSNLPELFG